MDTLKKTLKVCLFILFICGYVSRSQTVDNAIRFTDEFKFKTEIIKVDISPTENEGLEIALSTYLNNQESDTSFFLLQLKEEIFLTKLQQVIEKKFYSSQFSNEEKIWLNNIGYNIFRRMILLSISQNPQTPIAGYLYINDSVAISPYATLEKSLFLRAVKSNEKKLILVCDSIKLIRAEIDSIKLGMEFPIQSTLDICNNGSNIRHLKRRELKNNISLHLITLTLLKKELENKRKLKLAQNDLDFAERDILKKQKALHTLNALLKKEGLRIQNQIDSLKSYESEEKARLTFLKRELAINDRIQTTYNNLSENYKNIQQALRGAELQSNDSDNSYVSNKSFSDTVLSINNDLEKLLIQTKNEIDSLEQISPEGLSDSSKENTRQLKLNAQTTEDRITKIQDQINNLKMPKTIGDKGIDRALDDVRSAVAKRNEALKHLKELETSIERQIFGQFDVDSLQIEFYDGLIKNIYVVGDYLDTKLEFENPLPISFSALTDFRKYDDIELIDRGQNYKLPLKNIIRYVPQYNLNTEDYSPMNSNYFVIPTKKATVLLKEETTELLKAKIYTDLVGFDDDQPNGVIQSEISKKFIINAQKKYILKKPPVFAGLFNYYEPQLTFSKIENNNKELNYSTRFVTEDISNDTISTIDYVSTLDVLRYSYISLNFLNLNLLSIDAPDIKSTFELNGGISLYRTLLSDSVSIGSTQSLNRKNVNIFVPNFEFSWVIKPDPRYGIITSANILNVDLLNDEVLQVGDTDNYQTNKSAAKNSWVFNLQLEAFIKPNKNEGGEIFFRSRFYWLTKDANNNFAQIQLGYSFKILGRN